MSPPVTCSLRREAKANVSVKTRMKYCHCCAAVLHRRNWIECILHWVKWTTVTLDCECFHQSVMHLKSIKVQKFKRCRCVAYFQTGFPLKVFTALLMTHLG
ncbi:hypothetical protein ILYODFUR_014163 [Ilyodon furcidens]|uniref:Uncharacterized protein n=1 Tax=Ilyodon furcidens TaxID=33524 RepID=A0ABV0TUJ0_9TELE